MAENTEQKVLVDVEIGAMEALKILTELRAQANELREAQKSKVSDFCTGCAFLPPLAALRHSAAIFEMHLGEFAE
ncbi:MAG: hypothetical protein LBK18_06980 [Prevotellaceae bacterium]|jgi:hypothetical protein|nr:hypothetical protein [Prevotellaceae bacterium]